MRVRITALTHRGLVRDHNEDCIGWSGWAMNGEVTQPLSVEVEIVEPFVVVVCDGMGGHAGGETASRIATSMLTEGAACEAGTEEAVTALIQRASDAINDAAETIPFLSGMGCTAVGLVVHPSGEALVFNIGDSRCYRVEGRYLAQLSVDHREPASNALTQALGGGRRMILQPDFFRCALPGDPGLILCTDGLDDYADFVDIEDHVLAGGPDLVAGLRDLALAGKGGDNVSIVQVSLIDGGAGRG